MLFNDDKRVKKRVRRPKKWKNFCNWIFYSMSSADIDWKHIQHTSESLKTEVVAEIKQNSVHAAAVKRLIIRPHKIPSSSINFI